MLVIFIVLFVISIPILVYHKYCTVLDVWEKPLLFQKPPLHMTYGMLRLLIAWGSLVGISYFGGIIPGIIAVAIYFLVGTVGLRVFYQRQIAKWMPAFEKTIRDEERLPGDAPLPQPFQQEALSLATAAVNRAMKGES